MSAQEVPRVCLVTGGARGIGAATAILAAKSGYRVCVNYVESRQEAEAIVESVHRSGGRAITARADVSRENEVVGLFATIDRELGPVRAVVNNAGISGGRLPFTDVDLGMLRRVVDTNLIGTFLCTQQAARRMARSRGGAGGAIVNLSSRVTRSGGFRLSAYTASKGGIEGLTCALSSELASEGIRVNAVCPGVIATSEQTLLDTSWIEKTQATIPLGRLGSVVEVARAIVWLLSEEASYITGAIVPVTGGR